jgi:hypothetical protein
MSVHSSNMRCTFIGISEMQDRTGPSDWNPLYVAGTRYCIAGGHGRMGQSCERLRVAWSLRSKRRSRVQMRSADNFVRGYCRGSG